VQRADLDLIKRETRRNFVMQVVGLAAGKLMGVITMVLLARLLTPEDFGIVAIAGTFLGYVLLTGDLGLTEALIQRKDRVEDATHLLFLVRPILGVGQVALAFVAAPLVAYFFSDSRLTLVLWITSIVILIDSFASVPIALLIRGLRVRQITEIGLISGAVQSVAVIIMAFRGLSYWSMIYSPLIGSTLALVLLWRQVDYRPRLRLDRALLREMLGYGNFVVLSTVFFFLFVSTDNLMVGRLFGLEALGFYLLAYKFGTYPSTIFSASTEKVIFPAFVKLTSDTAQLRRAYLKTVRYVGLLAIPFAAILAIVAPQFIVVVAGEPWIASANLLRVLVIYGLALSL